MVNGFKVASVEVRKLVVEGGGGGEDPASCPDTGPGSGAPPGIALTNPDPWKVHEDQDLHEEWKDQPAALTAWKFQEDGWRERFQEQEWKERLQELKIQESAHLHQDWKERVGTSMHSLSNTLFSSQESYWRSGGVAGSPYPGLQPLGSVATNLTNSYYDQYSHPASRYIFLEQKDYFRITFATGCSTKSY